MNLNCFPVDCLLCRPLATRTLRPVCLLLAAWLPGCLATWLSGQSALGGIVEDLHLAQLRVLAVLVALHEDVACGARMRQHL